MDGQQNIKKRRIRSLPNLKKWVKQIRQRIKDTKNGWKLWIKMKKKIKEKQTDEMKANHKKIKDKDNPKSEQFDSLQFCNFFFLPDISIHFFILSRLTSCVEFFYSLRYYKLVKKNSVAWWDLWHFQLFTLTKDSKHKTISLYTPFFVIMAMRKNYKHKQRSQQSKSNFRDWSLSDGLLGESTIWLHLKETVNFISEEPYLLGFKIE